MTIPTRITIGLVATQALMLSAGLLASDGPYILWVLGSAGGFILVMLGAAAAPLAILMGLVKRRPSVRNCGFALLLLNTMPLAILLIVGEMIFGDQYEVRRADGTLRTQSVEQHTGGYSK